MNLQHQVRQNSEELQDFLKDLYKWEKDVQAKDKLLVKSTGVSDTVCPLEQHLIQLSVYYCKVK